MADLLMKILARIDVTVVLIIVICMAGSFSKDYLRIMKSTKPEKLSTTNIVLSTITATILTYGISDIVVRQFGDKSLIIVAYTTGLLGFQLLEKWSSLDGLLDFITKVKAVFKTSGSPNVSVNLNINGSDIQKKDQTVAQDVAKDADKDQSKDNNPK